MDIRLFKNGIGMKKAFETEYLYKETRDQWMYAFGTYGAGKISSLSRSIYLVPRDILRAKQMNLARQLTWGGERVIYDELKLVTDLLEEICVEGGTDVSVN